MASAIDQSVKRIVTEAYNCALDLIKANLAALDSAVDTLYDAETLSGDEFREIIAQYCAIPVENMEAVERQRLGLLEAQQRRQQMAVAVQTARLVMDQQ